MAHKHRVRQNIRDGHEEFAITADSWPAFLFPHAKADPGDIAKTLFRSALLLKVTKEFTPFKSRLTPVHLDL